MANLPSKHPSLTIHLTDRALTPIISSALSLSPSPSPHDQQDHASAVHEPEYDDHLSTTRLSALSHLTTTLLAAHDLVQRLGHGPPQRLMVETTTSTGQAPGPLVLAAFLGVSPALPPAPVPAPAPAPSSGPESGPSPAPEAASSSPAAVPPGESTTASSSRTASVATTTSTTLPDGSVATDTTVPLRLTITDSRSGSSQPQPPAGVSSSSANAPPMLIGVVVAPSGDGAMAAEARQAAGRLERVGRRVQAVWVEEAREDAGAGEAEEAVPAAGAGTEGGGAGGIATGGG